MRSNAQTDTLDKITSVLEARFGVPQRNPRSVSPLTTLIATVLSQNTNDKNSFTAYQNLRAISASWEKISRLDTEIVKQAIRPAGLVNQKAETIATILNLVYRERSLTVERKELKKLSDAEIIHSLVRIRGVGYKTAACVLLFALGRNVCPVDTHVHRTLNRIGMAHAATPDKTFEQIQVHLPPGNAHSLHTNLIMLGRTYCQPGKLYCGHCPIVKFCAYKKKDLKSIHPDKTNVFLLLDSL